MPSYTRGTNVVIDGFGAETPVLAPPTTSPGLNTVPVWELVNGSGTVIASSAMGSGALAPDSFNPSAGSGGQLTTYITGKATALTNVYLRFYYIKTHASPSSFTYEARRTVAFDIVNPPMYYGVKNFSGICPAIETNETLASGASDAWKIIDTADNSIVADNTTPNGCMVAQFLNLPGSRQLAMVLGSGASNTAKTYKAVARSSGVLRETVFQVRNPNTSSSTYQKIERAGAAGAVSFTSVALNSNNTSNQIPQVSYAGDFWEVAHRFSDGQEAIIGAKGLTTLTMPSGVTNVFKDIDVTKVSSTISLGAHTNVPAGIARLRYVLTASTTYYSKDIELISPAPTITSFTPGSGTVGDTVTVNGTNFVNPTVELNGTPATPTVVSDTQLTFPVPLGATTGKIKIATSGGTVYSATDFTVTGGGGGGLGTPNAPDVVIDEDMASMTAPATLATGATHYRAELSVNGGGYVVLDSSVLANEVVTFAVQGGTIYRARWVAVDGSSNQVAGIATEPFVAPCSPSVADIPDTPAAPTLGLTNCNTVTITPPAWVDDEWRPTLYMKLRRSIDGGATWTELGSPAFDEDGQDYEDTPADYGEVLYQVAAGNGAGYSAWSASASIDVGSTIVPEWISNININGVLTLVAEAGDPDDLDPDEPVTIKLNGAPLEVTQTNADQFVAYFDTRTLDFNGNITFYLQAKDADGCLSVPVPLVVAVNNTLERNTTYSQKELTPESVAEMTAEDRVVSYVAYHAEIKTDGASELQKWRRWYVKSPDPGAFTSLQLADYEAMKETLRDWQDVAPNDVTRLRGTTGPSARLVMESTPPEMLSYWELDSDVVLKFSRISDEELEVVTADNYQRFDKDGLTLIATYADYGVSETVVDAIKIDDKVFVATVLRLAVIDLTVGDISYAQMPFNESAANLIAAEKLEATALLVFASGGTTRVYKVGSSIQQLFQLSTQATKAWMQGTSLVLATTDFKIYESKNGAAPTLIYTHDANVTALQFATVGQLTGVLEFGDASDRIYRAINSAPALVANGLGGDVTALAQFKGAASTLRGAASVAGGSNAGKLLLQNPAGVYLPTWTIPDATAIVELARLNITIREATGDPLMGGDAGLFSEQLIGGYHTASGARLFRLQQADIDKSKAILARAVNNQRFRKARDKAAPTT